MAARKWTYEEIVERSDELAARFEAFDLDAAENVPVAEYLEARAVRQRARGLLDDLLSRDEHAAFVQSLDDDPELATT